MTDRNLGWITETEQSLLRGGCGWDEVLLACADGAAWRAEAATRGNEG